ncbi:MAG TPA: hypothetical protein DCS12_08570 [Clostridiales bacterium]|nr:hypothetical protein [Clostridiales bacterium]
MNTTFNYLKDKEVKRKIKCYTINIPMYHCVVKIVFGKQAKQLEKDWNRSADGFGGLTRNYLKKYGEVLISFPVKKPKIKYVTHEFYHAITMIMENIGHKIKIDSDEPPAYLMSYLISEYLKIKQ